MRSKRIRKNSGVLLALVATQVAAWSQAPVVSSLVNSASYQPTLGGGGTIATIFGTNLAAAPASAQSTPLPLQLGGTSVTVGGVAAPLFYVSPAQINFQVPNGANDVVVVSTASGISAAYNPDTATPNAWYAGGVFTMDASGCGPGAVLNNAADGIVSLNSPANSAEPGGSISVFGSGIAYIRPPVLIGYPTPLSALISSQIVGGIQFDLTGAENGLPRHGPASAPSFVGLDQMNVAIPQR